MLPPSVVDTERRRRDLENPVDVLNTIATFWLECALAYHPERQAELDALSTRLEEATGDIAKPSADPSAEAVFAKTETVQEQIAALEEIVIVMRSAAELMRDPSKHAIIVSIEDLTTWQ